MFVLIRSWESKKHHTDFLNLQSRRVSVVREWLLSDSDMSSVRPEGLLPRAGCFGGVKAPVSLSPAWVAHGKYIGLK